MKPWYGPMAAAGREHLVKLRSDWQHFGMFSRRSEYDEIMAMRIKAGEAAAAIFEANPPGEENAWDYMDRIEALLGKIPSPERDLGWTHVWRGGVDLYLKAIWKPLRDYEMSQGVPLAQL